MILVCVDSWQAPVLPDEEVRYEKNLFDPNPSTLHDQVASVNDGDDRDDDGGAFVRGDDRGHDRHPVRSRGLSDAYDASCDVVEVMMEAVEAEVAANVPNLQKFRSNLRYSFAIHRVFVVSCGGVRHSCESCIRARTQIWAP